MRPSTSHRGSSALPGPVFRQSSRVQTSTSDPDPAPAGCGRAPVPSGLLGLARAGISSVQLGADEHQCPQGSSALPGPVFRQSSWVQTSTSDPDPAPAPAGCERAPVPSGLLVGCWCTVQSSHVPVRNQHQRYGGGGSTFYLLPRPPVPRSSQSDII